VTRDDRESYEVMEALDAPPAPDFSAYRYDAPWQPDDPPDADEEPFEDPAPNFYDGLYTDPYADDFDDFDDDEEEERDDELFEALDEALDEMEAEARVDAVLAIAAPEDDELEPHGAPQRLYRDHLTCFLGGDARLVAPRYTQLCRRYPVGDPALKNLLEDGQRRARISREQRKAVGRITNPGLRSALIY
jgi:hypothetical protein